jgi:hypothetical protein
MIRHAFGGIVIVGLLAGAAQPVRAQTASAPMIAPAPAIAPTPVITSRHVASLDREVWAGISYREAIVGLAVLGGGAAVVTWLTSSVISGMTAAVAVAAGYVIYDPGITGVLSPSDLPRMPDLAVNGSDQKK